MKIAETDVVIAAIVIILISGSSYLYFTANKPYCGDGVCQDNEVKLCFADCDWCGDGLCREDEEGLCSFDCDWCGDNFCHVNESCSTCSQDCGNCEADSYCGNGICNPGECEIGCTKDCRLLDCQDGVCESELGENCVNTPNDCRCDINEKCSTKTRRCEIITCGNGRCDSNENTGNCPADCRESYIPPAETIDPNTNLPIVFVHGHSAREKENIDYSNIMMFVEFQYKLEKDGLYINKGVLLPSARKDAVAQGLWGKLGKPVSVRTTYYLGVYDERGSIIGSEDERSISVYADRVKKTVDVLKSHTGKNKVIIIAHSMGGLVAREYIRKYGNSDVDMLIAVGAPNHGTYGYVGWVCPLMHSGPECEDMKAGSDFLNRLNQDETPGNTRYITIAGNCCLDKEGKRWDEIVRVESAALKGATNFMVMGEEVPGLGGTFHNALVYPSRAPDVYGRIVKILE